MCIRDRRDGVAAGDGGAGAEPAAGGVPGGQDGGIGERLAAVSYTHLRAHETVLDLVCRLLLEKKN